MLVVVSVYKWIEVGLVAVGRRGSLGGVRKFCEPVCGVGVWAGAGDRATEEGLGRSGAVVLRFFTTVVHNI